MKIIDNGDGRFNADRDVVVANEGKSLKGVVSDGPRIKGIFGISNIADLEGADRAKWTTL